VIETISPALWEETRSLRPIVEQQRDEADSLRIACCCRRISGGRGLSPLCVFDLIEEVASYDGSVG